MLRKRGLILLVALVLLVTPVLATEETTGAETADVPTEVFNAGPLILLGGIAAVMAVGGRWIWQQAGADDTPDAA